MTLKYIQSYFHVPIELNQKYHLIIGVGFPQIFLFEKDGKRVVCKIADIPTKEIKTRKKFKKYMQRWGFKPLPKDEQWNYI